MLNLIARGRTFKEVFNLGMRFIDGKIKYIKLEVDSKHIGNILVDIKVPLKNPEKSEITKFCFTNSFITSLELPYEINIEHEEQKEISLTPGRIILIKD